MVRPAELPPRDVDPRISAPAVGDQDPGECRAEEFFGDLCAALGANEEQRHRTPHRTPQPGSLTSLVPAGLVGVDHRLLSDGLRDLFDRRCDRLAGRLL
jgi:hypothetical protein